MQKVYLPVVLLCYRSCRHGLHTPPPWYRIRTKLYCNVYVCVKVECRYNRNALLELRVPKCVHLSKPSRCVSVQLVYIFMSYTTINIIIHTIKCYKLNGCMFLSPLRPSSGQLLQIVHLQCAYNMGSHNVYIIFYIWTKITVKSFHC